MTSRRVVLKSIAAAAASAALGRAARAAAIPSRAAAFESNRPKPADRKFTSAAVDAKIAAVKRDIADPELAWMFENCFPNTLDTTVEVGTLDGKPDTFVITGDIHAMWLRDSAAQVWPYLPFAKDDPALKRLLAGVVNRQAKCVLVDPYANAFNKEATGSEWAKDITDMKPELHERKWEIDSLCYVARLAHGYWKSTGDTSCFDAEWRKAMALVLQTFREQQRKNGPGPYHFQRVTSWAPDNLSLGGYGNPGKPVGLIFSGFRPSDDACIFPFLVPSNMFAVVALRGLAEIFSKALGDAKFAGECTSLASEVEAALARYARVQHPKHGEILAYEVDGFGGRNHMDDANVPNLLGLPYLGSVRRDDPVYERTRGFVLSDDNPYFFRGAKAEGVGGPHVGLGMIWPMSVIMRALTSTDDGEVSRCLSTLKATHAGTGFMHESFNQDDPTKFTRKWFAWANTLFGELVVKVHAERPALLRRTL